MQSEITATKLGERKCRLPLIRSRAYDLLINSSNMLPISESRLVEAREKAEWS